MNTNAINACKTMLIASSRLHIRIDLLVPDSSTCAMLRINVLAMYIMNTVSSKSWSLS